MLCKSRTKRDGHVTTKFSTPFSQREETLQGRLDLQHICRSMLFVPAVMEKYYRKYHDF